MAVVTRASLPEEFFDITSALLLVQPEPQYLHCMLAKAAMGIAFSGDAGFGMAGRPAPNSGEPYASADAQRLIMSDPIASEAIKAISAPKGIGHTIRVNRPKFADTTYTEASREVISGGTISTTPIDFGSEQVSITVKRFAGPYDSTNSRVAPIAIDEFDAKHSLHDLVDMRGMQLKRDFDKWLDSVLVLLFDSVASGQTLYPTGMSADNDATTADAFPLDLNQLFRAEETLATANIPRFGDGTYACVLHPRQVRELKDDAQFGRYVEQHKERNPVFDAAFVGKVGSLRIFQSNTIRRVANSSTVNIHYGQMFGPSKVALAVGEMPRVLMSTDDNYGLQSKVIWEFEAGLQNLDNRFGCSVRSS